MLDLGTSFVASVARDPNALAIVDDNVRLTYAQWYARISSVVAAFDHEEITLAGRERLRAKLSYSNAGFALAPPEFTLSELREIYVAALGHPVSATNLKRVLLRRGALEPTGETRGPGPSGGRPAALFRFRTRRLEITDPFAVLRPPR
jgi:8-oxo-dGTP diphosphatase